jgi:hypothetical protein
MLPFVRTGFFARDPREVLLGAGELIGLALEVRGETDGFAGSVLEVHAAAGTATTAVRTAANHCPRRRLIGELLVTAEPLHDPHRFVATHANRRIAVDGRRQPPPTWRTP